MGDGASYEDLVRRGWGPGAVKKVARRVMAPPMLAGAVGRMAVARARLGGAIGPGEVHPLYVRRPDAELDRDRRSLNRKGPERQ